MRNLNDWLKLIEQFHPSEIELGLIRVKQIADKLGLLTPTAKVVLVGGTNGKGSCVATLESLAKQSHLTVGCYTSPHLIHFNERIRINGANIDDKSLVEAFETIEKIREQVALTFFEFTTL
ncbi:MAG: bifunctional tetrahydrofolate synthase/dihydrofolate synthase, partial [Kangiellaceae bacterium]